MRLWRVGQDKDGVATFELVREMSAKEAELYLESCQHLHDFERARDMFVFVTDSLEAFRSGIAEHSEVIARDKRGALDQDPRPRRKLQRLAVDYLNAMRLYLDHRRTHLSRAYGRESSVLAAFDTARRSVHEREPVYRFTYELRNFVQHCGMPLQALSANLELVTSGSTETVKAELMVGFRKSDLLEQYDGWRHGKAFIDLQEEEFEALPVFERTTDCLWEIEEATIEALLPDLWRDAKQVTLVLQEGTNSRAIGMPVEMVSANADGTRTTISLKAPPFSILSWLKFVTVLDEAPGLAFNSAVLSLDHPPKLVRK